jgi:hypothetical protein
MKIPAKKQKKNISSEKREFSISKKKKKLNLAELKQEYVNSVNEIKQSAENINVLINNLPPNFPKKKNMLKIVGDINQRVTEMNERTFSMPNLNRYIETIQRIKNQTIIFTSADADRILYEINPSRYKKHKKRQVKH